MRTHLEHAYRKLQVHTRTAAVARAFASRTSTGRGVEAADRTRVSRRTGQNVYKRSPRFNFERAAGGGRLTDDLAILGKCRASGDWLSLRAEPVIGAATLTTMGPVRSDVVYLTRLGSECEFVIRTYCFAGGFTRPTGDLGLQLCRRIDHVEARSPPYVS